ncbi:hypothetical protein ACNQ1X_00425 [Mycoplasma sp. SK341A]|uniref:hypothetical protein n=1 Tax=unclassified Mycoplasma TaxID=2683645 RepID=UPI003A87C2B4
METKLLYKVGQVVTAKVTRTGSKFALLEDKNNSKFIIYKNEVTDFYKMQVYDILQVKDIVNFVVIGYDQNTNQYIGSFKRNHPNFLKSEQYFSNSKNRKNELKETKNGFANLREFTLSYIDPEAAKQAAEDEATNIKE